MKDWDVLILGAGAAATAAAITCAGQGMRVCMVERQGPDACKPCGDGLGENSVRALSALGVSVDALRAAGAYAIARSVHSWPDERAEIPHGDDAFFVLSKRKLQQCLRSRAEALGVQLLWQTREQPVFSDGQWTLGGRARAPRLINASGCQTGVWQSAAARRTLPLGGMALVRARAALDDRTIWFWHLPDDTAGYCWAFPMGGDVWNLGVWRREKQPAVKADFQRFMARWEGELAADTQVLQEARFAFLGTRSTLLPPTGASGWYAAGDLTGSCAIVGGEGISGALRSGINAARLCLADGGYHANA